ATGAAALSNNTTGSLNTANRSSALGDNTTGIRNTAKVSLLWATISPVTTTRPPELKRALVTSMDLTIRRPGSKRLVATLVASVTRPSATYALLQNQRG